MQIEYCCTYWGCEDKEPADFLEAVCAAGFSGAEINLASGNFDRHFVEKLQTLRQKGFKFIAQQVLDGADESVDDYIYRVISRLEFLADFQPDSINSHTGKDFFSFGDNCRIIDAVENFSIKRGIPVFHETHRGRFTFHLATLLPYLEKFPELKLTADFSHWCCVSESMLADQQQLLARVMPHVRHMHARVGWEQSAQVNDPFAPEWKGRVDLYLSWWKQILACIEKRGVKSITITPEAGPYPYMPEHPYSRLPIAGQWDINIQMKNFLTSHLYGKG